MRRKGIFVFLIILLLGFAVYSNTFWASFQFDDEVALVKNRAIWRLNLPALWGAFNTRFVTGVTFALNYALGGFNVFGYHLFNITCHILSSFLVYVLVSLVFQAPAMKDHPLESHREGVAFCSGVLFLVHPVQTMAVNYIWQRAASLATLFYLISVTSYLKARLTSRRIYFGASLFSTLLGMFTKEIAFTIPFMLFLIEIFFLGSEKDLWRRLRFLLPQFLTLCVIPLTLSRANRVVMPVMYPEYPMSYREYLLTQLNAFRTYWRLLFFPIAQNVDYDYPVARGLLEPGTFFSFLFFLAMGGVMFKTFRKNRLLSFGLAWFFLSLSVESGIRLLDPIFEYRLYLPMVGFSLFFTATSFYFLKQTKRIAILFSVLFLVFSLATFRRNAVWRDPVTFWEDTVRKSPGKPRPYSNLSGSYLEEGRIEEAIEASRKALKLDPFFVDAFYNLGLAYARKGEYEKALPPWERVLKEEKNPNRLAELNRNFGVISTWKGETDQALRYFEKALELDPESPEICNNLGYVYFTKRKYEQAVSFYQKALELRPGDLEADQGLKMAQERLKWQKGTLE